MATQRNWTPTQQRYIDMNKAQGCEAEVFWHAPLDQCLAEIRRVYAIRRKGEMGRRYYYALLTAGLLKTWAHVYEPNSVKSFPTSIVQAQAWVSGILTAARRNGTLPWSAVYGASRSSWSESHIDLSGDLRMIGTSYFSLDPWLGQKQRVEVWVEKEDAFDMVLDICRPYQVPVLSAKGFGSADPFHRAAQRYGTGKNHILYWLGDFDPSGMEIEESFYRILWEEGCRAVRTERLAITHEQSLLLDPVAAQELKRGDSRYKKFVARYGKDTKGFELDAYPSDQLERDLKAVILSHIDGDAWNEALRLERGVRSWVTKQARALLGNHAKGWSRDIRRGAAFIDTHTGLLFPQDVLDLYLGEPDDDDDDDSGGNDDNDDGDDDDGDDDGSDDDGSDDDGSDDDDDDDYIDDPAVNDAIAHAMDAESDAVREAWRLLKAATTYDDEKSQTVVWATLYAQEQGMTVEQAQERAWEAYQSYKESFIESNAQAIASGDIEPERDLTYARLNDVWYRLEMAIEYGAE